MPASIAGQIRPSFTIAPSLKTLMTADTYIEVEKRVSIAFNDAVSITLRDGEGNEDSVSLGPFPEAMDIDSSVTHFKVDINTTCHGMGGR